MSPAPPRPETVLPGIAAQAIAAAWPLFEREGASAARYEVLVVRHPEAFEVIFAPEPDPGPSVRGGGTSAGRELHCWVAPDGRVLRQHYAR